MASTKVIELYSNYKEIFFGKKLFLFERLAKLAYRILRLKVKDAKKIKEYNSINEEIHLNITYDELYSLAVLTSFIIVLIAIPSLIISPIIFLLLIILSLVVYALILNYPKLLYNDIRKKKEGQLVSAVLYMAMKLRENPNLEIAFEYATRYIQPPLKLDFLKLMWEVYNRKYSSISDALTDYIKRWEEEAYYFVEGVQLLISALYEQNPLYREYIIDKAVETTLEGLYEKLSFYVRELQSPIRLIYMLGIVLPTLLLTLLPIASFFIPELSASFAFFLFDIFIPILVYILIKTNIEAKRTELVQKSDLYLYLYMRKYDARFKVYSFIIAALAFIGISFIAISLTSNFLYDYTSFSIILSNIFILSASLAVAFGCYIYYKFYGKLISRLESIEKDISSFLFSLGNKLNENIPIEQAFLAIYPQFKKKAIGRFIANVLRNLQLGMSIYDAIFDTKKGALISYPSSYLEASMEIILESARVSPKSAAKAAISISKYFIYLERIKLRLLDLTAEVTSQMKSLAKVLAPAILGVVAAIAIMSLNILYKLGLAFKEIKASYQSNYGYQYMLLSIEILNLITLKGRISPATIILTVGLFNLLITILIAYMLNIIENGRDAIREKKYIYSSLLLSSILFFIIATFGSITLWNFADAVTSIISP